MSEFEIKYLKGVLINLKIIEIIKDKFGGVM